MRRYFNASNSNNSKVRLLYGVNPPPNNYAECYARLCQHNGCMPVNRYYTSNFHCFDWISTLDAQKLSIRCPTLPPTFQLGEGKVPCRCSVGKCWQSGRRTLAYPTPFLPAAQEANKGRIQRRRGVHAYTFIFCL